MTEHPEIIRLQWYDIIPAVLIGGLLPLLACGACFALIGALSGPH